MSGIVGPRLSTIPPTFFDDYSFEFGGGNTCVVFQPTLNIDATNGLTLSFWVKLNISAPWDYVISAGSSGVDSQLNLRWNAGGGLTSWIVGSSQATGINTGYGTWRHIVMTINYSNGDVKFYMDGVVSSTVLTFGSNYANAKLSTIGAYNSTGINPTDGLIDEVSIFRSVFDQTAITNLYNDGKPTDLTSLSPHVWIRMGDNAIYKSPQWLLPSNENKDKASNYSMSFDGTDDHMSIGRDVANFSYTEPFSMSLWFKPSLFTAYDTFISKNMWVGNYPLGGGHGWTLYYNNSIRFDLNGSKWNDYENLQSVTNPYNNLKDYWHHLVLTYSGTRGIGSLKMYLDGFDVSGTAGSVNNGGVLTSSATTIVGDRDTTSGVGQSSAPFPGNLDDISIYDYTLTQSEVSVLYNGTGPTGGGTTSPWNDGTGKPYDTDLLTPSKQPIHKWKMGENATFKDPQWLIPNNENKDKISNYSMSFDGTDDYIDCGSFTPMDSATELTISVWFKSSVYTGFGRLVNVEKHVEIFQGSDSASNTKGTFTYVLMGQFGNSFKTLGGGTQFGVSDLCDGKWHHLCFVWNKSTTTAIVYEDGVAVITDTSTTGGPLNSVTDNLYIGADPAGANPIKGNVDEVAIWDTALSPSDVVSVYNLGTPPDLSSLNPISYWKMGEDATFSTNWTVPDQIGSNDGTSANMDIYDRVGESPGSSGNTVSYNMDIYDRVGSASGSENNALSYNMVLSGRTTDVPT